MLNTPSVLKILCLVVYFTFFGFAIACPFAIFAWVTYLCVAMCSPARFTALTICNELLAPEVNAT